MESYTLNICKITQSPEKFLCLHQECRSLDKKQVQCYECINKQHIVGKNKTIRHHDDIIELDKFMKQIQDKCIRKESFLNQLILTCNDFQKEKIQQIELIYQSDVAKVMSEKIENEIQQLTSLLGQESIKLKGYLIYSQSKHLELINFYFENDQLNRDQMRSQYKALVDKIQSYVLSFNCDIKQQISKLEQKIKCMEVNRVQLPTVALILISLIISYFFNQNNFEQMSISLQTEYNNKVLQIDQQLLYLQEQKQIFVEYEQYNHTFHLWENKIQSIKEELNITQENLEKLKSRFDAFKKNQQNLTNDLRNQIQEMNGSVRNEDVSQMIKAIQQSNSRLEVMINEKDADIQQLKNQTSLLLSQNPILTQKQRIFLENSDILGKINKNVSLSRFSKFTLIYDHYFNKYIALSTLDRLYKLASKNNEDPLICMGALSVENLSEFLLVACDYASEVFQPTENDRLARKSKSGDIYWYVVDYFSFGFSPNEQIRLVTCDDEDLDSELRFSYWFGIKGRIGGRRIGRLNRLENSLDHKIQIYMLR